MLKHRLVSTSRRYAIVACIDLKAYSLSLSLSLLKFGNLENGKQFKALEAMAEHVRPEGHLLHALSSSPKKLEKYGTKTRGSGSPFKCIGLGLAQQIKSERDEELTAARMRIEELESLAVSRQKEVGLTHLHYFFLLVAAKHNNMGYHVMSRKISYP